MQKQILRQMPRVDNLVACANDIDGALPYHIILECCQDTLTDLRQAIIAGTISTIPPLDQIARQALKRAHSASCYSLRPVINATGVVLHTNLGRAILCEKAAENVKKIAMSYSTLEYSLQDGERGSRHAHIQPLLCALSGAEAAMAVNNNAAAVMLALMALCKDKEVIVSRGELVEIGGSFRVPDIMALSGATLKEVGTTNKTKLSDYEAAITQNTAALLKVHTSNFKVVGFCQQVQANELADLGKKHNIPIIYDLGSGLCIDDDNIKDEEVSVCDCIRGGADVVCFSGDKLFGGPQAGIIVGKKDLIDKIRSHQFARAVRIDKLTLAALEATLRAYSCPLTAVEQIPTLSALALTPQELKKRAQKLVRMLPKTNLFKAVVRESEGQVGGGSAPARALPSFVVEISSTVKSAKTIEKELRDFDTPIITRISKGNVLIDVRTVLQDQLKTIARAFKMLAEGVHE